MTPAEREGLILGLRDRVEKLSFKFVPTFVSRQDLMQAGWLGAIKAVDTYDPGAGVPLTAYATICIRGAIQDYLRDLDTLSRRQRKNIRLQKDAPVRTVPLPPRSNAMADGHSRREQAFLEASIDLESVFRKCPGALTDVLIRRELYGESLVSVADSLGINPSRVSQICGEAIESIRKKLKLTHWERHAGTATMGARSTNASDGRTGGDQKRPGPDSSEHGNQGRVPTR